MGKTFSITTTHVTIHKDGESPSFKLSTDTGACLKVMIDNINKPLDVAYICDQADLIFKSFNKPPFKDRGRAVRALHGKFGIIDKSGKGKYIFTGKYGEKNQSTFTPALKAEILKKHNYTCYFCGLSKLQGAELGVDHILPESKGGKATLENGMTLCTRCNNIKSNYSVHTFGKKAFTEYLKIAKILNNSDEIKFFEEVLKVFEKYKKD